jgi:hypothetical protein
MTMKYRDDMTDAELEALMAEVNALDEAYPVYREPEDDEQEENFDPIRDGWVGRDGQP